MRLGPWTVLLAVLLVLPAASAAPLASVVAAGDPSMGKPLAALDGAVAYLDANGDNKVDAASPDEPLYVDVDRDGSAGYADVRLTPFGDYPAGSLVDLGNRDFGLRLAALSGWIVAGGNGAWYVDADASSSVTAGDVRLAGQGPEGKVRTGDAALGEALPSAQSGGAFRSLSLLDGDGDGRHDAGEALFVDADRAAGAQGQVTAGDLRFAAGAFAKEPALQGAAPATPAANPVPQGLTGSWRTLDWILVLLTIVNLAGLAMAARAQRPKNPFK